MMLTKVNSNKTNCKLKGFYAGQEISDMVIMVTVGFFTLGGQRRHQPVSINMFVIFRPRKAAQIASGAGDSLLSEWNFSISSKVHSRS